MACLVTRPDVPPEMLDILKPRCEILDIWEEETTMPRNELLQRIKNKSALICTISDRIDNQVLSAAGNSLRVIGTMSVGFDHIDVDECRKRGIKVGNTPHVLTDAVAELTVALLLATSRRLFEAERALRQGDWKPGWTHFFMCGSALRGSTLGIVGLGRIGLAILERLFPFKPARCLYSGHSEKPGAAQFGAQFVPFEQLLRESDFVLICCSLNSETTNMFDSRAFSQMKSNAILINSSRGAIIDEEALVEALKSGRIKGAGLDVMRNEPLPLDDPLMTLDNVAPR